MVDGQSFRQQGLCITLTLVLFIRGYQGFFIKHSSGLCLQPASKYREKGKQTGPISGQWGPLYVVIFQNTCRHSDAQFYFDKTYSVLYNIAKDGTFLARDMRASSYQYKFHIYHSPQPKTPKLFNLLNKFVLKQTSAGTLQSNNGYCPTSINYSSQKPNNPLIGSAVYQTKKKFICDKEEEKFMFGEVIKEGENMINVSCSPAQVMKVVMAEYGGFSNGKTFVHKDDADCSLPSACVVKSQCDGNTSCNMNVNSSLFKKDPCQGKTKELHMEYVCVDSLTKPITIVSKVRLSAELPNQGFVEILNGTTWRKVDDRNWDKRKHAALCRHLGYDDSKSVNDTKEIDAGQMIASGDLYCSGIQPSSQSCCAYLYPSTSTQKNKIPYVACKICDEPLLQNSTRFPDNIFSASDSNGHKARLSNNGWCPAQISGTQYLQIDLQRVFFISHIATFGDKTRTKWTTSYELQYTRLLSELDSSVKRMIIANNDAYRASITALNISYVRFLRITVQQANGFCIRIQLCGYVLLPDAVENITIYNKSARTAKIYWTFFESERLHSGVTYFLISLKASNSVKIITLHGGNNHEYKFQNLNPFTNYTVNIQAGNGYGLSDVASQTFMTDEAAPSGPPLNVKVTVQSASSLLISWKAPELKYQNGVITNYTICLSHSKDETCFKEYVTNNYEFLVINLLFSTKYWLRILASTRVGSGDYSRSQEAFTNGNPLSKPVCRTANTLLFLSQIPKEHVSYFEVIAVYLPLHTVPNKSPNTYSNQELSRYIKIKDSLQSVPYIAAVFSVSDESSRVFALGDGNEYSQPRIRSDTSEVERYFNGPLQENSTYSVFQRFFKDKNDYYSTDWSPPATTNTTLQSYGGKAATKTSKQSSATSLFVGIGISLVLNVVLIVVVIYLTVCRARSQPLAIENVVAKVENRAFSDDVYHEPDHANNEISNTYEELNLKERETDEHTYQSLVKEATS